MCGGRFVAKTMSMGYSSDREKCEAVAEALSALNHGKD